MFSRRRSLFEFSRRRLEKGPRRQKRRNQKQADLAGGYHTRLGVEQLEDRRMLSVTAILNGSNDAIITGSVGIDIVTMEIRNPGTVSERLWIVDGVSATAGTGFTQETPQAVSILTSAVTGNDIMISTAGSVDTVQVLSTPSGKTTTVNTEAGTRDELFVGVRGHQYNTGIGTLANLAGNLLSDDPNSYVLYIDNSGNASNSTWTIDSTGANLGRVAASGITGTIEFKTFEATQLEIVGGDGDDVFTVDLSGGNIDDPLPFGDLTLRGGGQLTSDQIVLQGATLDTLTHTFGSPNNGTVVFDDFTPTNDQITYLGFEPIIDNLNVANRVFTFTNPANNIELTNVSATQTRIDSNQSESVDFTTPTNSLTVNLANGSNMLTVSSLAGNYQAAPGGTLTNTINGGTGVDIVNMEVTDGSDAEGTGVEPWTFDGNGGNDTLNISPAAKLVDNLDDPVMFTGNGGTGDTLNVEDDNNGGGTTYTVTSTTITETSWSGTTGGVTYNGTTENVNLLDTGGGADTIDVTSTSGTATTTIQGAAGNDTYNITASSLGGTNNFNGNAGNDLFNVNIGAAGGISATLNIEGDANDAGDRDEVEINDLPAGAARVVNIAYPTTGVGDTTITGLNSAGTFTVGTTETIDYDGTGAADTFTVTGTVSDSDLITVAPISGTRALVFNGGDPFDGPPDVFATSLPGIAGPGTLPDLDLEGLIQATGLTINEADTNTTTGDRLYVYGQSEVALVDPAATGRFVDPFGFGNQEILDNVTLVATARDNIAVNDTMTQIVAANGTGASLVRVNYDNVDFVQATPNVNSAVVINAGEETTNPNTPPPNADSDEITLTLSSAYKFQINGNDPDPATTNVEPPSGDELILEGAPIDTINVFSNKNPGGQPQVTIEFPGTGLLPFGVSSIEELPVFSATTVNLFGDNNDVAVDQNDNFVVVGADVDGDATDGGRGEFALIINGSSVDANGLGLLRFNSVQFLNVFGDDAALTPSGDTVATELGDIDTLDITPYADDTPRGWGIDVSFNEGDPAGADGDQADLLIYNTAAQGGMVSENISIRPSGPDNGELIATNASDGSLIVDIDYMANTDIIINDNDTFVNDTDTVTLWGTNGTTPQTSGNETFAVDFDAAGLVASPQVTVTDTVGSAILYRLRSLTNIEQVTFNTSDGNDALTFASPAAAAFANGVEQLNVNGGLGNDTVTYNVQGRDIGNGVALNFDGGAGADSVTVTGTPTTSPITSITYNVGADVGDGQIILNDGAAPNFVLDFQNLEPATVLVPSPTLIVNANGAANQINYTQGSAATRGLVSIDDHETVEFANQTNLTINAGAGSDTISLNNDSSPADLTTINVNAGGPTDGSDTVVVNDAANDTNIDITAIGVGAATITDAQLDTVNVSGAELLIIDGKAGDDTMVLHGDAIDNDRFVHTPGNAPDAGRFEIFNETDADTLLPIQYADLGIGGNVHVSGEGGTDTLVARGTAGADMFAIDFDNATADRPTIDLTTTLGTHVDLDGVEEGIDVVVIEALGDNDTINVQAPVNLNASGSLQIIGGDSDSTTDSLNLTGAAATAETVVIRADATNPTEQDVTGLGALIDVSGIELIKYTGDNNNDTLTVELGVGVATARVQSATPADTDEVLSSTLPDVQFTAVQNFVLSSGTDPATATFVLDGLAGATNYTFDSNDDNDTLVIEGDGGADAITASLNAGNLRVAGSGATIDTTGMTSTDLLEVNTLGGDDTLTVDNSGGLVATPALFDGGSDHDQLILQGSTAITTATYDVGPGVDQGRVTHAVAAGATQVVDFENLEPVIDVVVATTLTVNATNADNAINYRVGRNNADTLDDATRGRVTVDGFESIDFSNKQNLELNGLAGSDEISLNNPNTPTRLTGITVNGGDPTAGSDTAIVSGTTVADAINFAPTTDDDAVVTGAGPVAIILATIESTVIDGQGAADTLTYTSPAGVDLLTHTRGADFTSGSITGVQKDAPFGPLMPLLFTNIANNAAGALTFEDAAAGTGPRTDSLTIVGTPNDDTFAVTAVTGAVAVTRTSTTNLSMLQIATPGIQELVLTGLDGDDTFNVPGNHPYTVIAGGLGGIVVEGGNPDDGSDILNFTAGSTAANLVTANLGLQTITEATFGALAYSGIETANVNANNHNLTVRTTPGDDVTDVSPTGANAGTLQNNGVSPVVNFSNTGTLSIDQLAGDDVLQTRYSTNAETIEVNVPAGAISVSTGFETVNFVNADTEAVEVYGNEGSDTFNVTADPNIPIFVDGGDPIGTSPGDTLNILAGGGGVVVEPGPENDEGGVIVGANERVSFDHIESLGVNNATKAFIAGTGADDDITIIARDVSTHAGADGVQDFTSQVNGAPQILWIDTPQIVVDAQAGDDDIIMRVPAPNNANWNVTAWIFGGAPAAGPGDEGDRFELETPQTTPDNVIITPTAVDSATIVIDEVATGAFDPATDTIIQIGNVPAMPPMPGFPNPDPGGIETLVYDGEAGNDVVTINATAANDVIQHMPGVDPDEGTLTVNSLLGVLYNDLGLTGVVNINGAGGTADQLHVFGTPASDVFTIPHPVVAAPSVALNNRIGLGTTAVETISLRGLGGDDTFNVTSQANVEIDVDGDEPGVGSDMLNFTSIGATTLDLGASDINDAGVAGDPDVTYSGIETLNIAAANQNLTVVGTANDDAFDVTPQGPNNGTLQANGVAPVVNFAATGVLTIDGGAGSAGDFVNVNGTTNHDVISVNSPTRTVTVTNAAGVVLEPVVLAGNIESVKVSAGLGSDTIVVVPAPATATGPGGAATPTVVPINLLVDVDGGPPNASDALVIAGSTVGAALPASDFVVHNKGRNPDTGRLRVFRNATAMPDISYSDVEIISPLVAGGQINPQLLNIGPDLFEENETFPNAAFLGTGQTINVANLAIFPDAREHRFVPADNDFFRVVAEQTGTLDIVAYFRAFNPALLPGGGDIQLQVLDAGGTVIAGGGPNFGTNNEGGANTNDERIRIPAVAGQTYYIRAFGNTANVDVNGLNSVTNGYDLTITNTAPTIPYDIELGDILATGAVAGIPSAATAAQTYVTLGPAAVPGVLNPTAGFYNGAFINILTGAGNAAIGTRALITGYTGNAAGNLPGGVVGAPAFSFSFATPPSGLGNPPVAGDAYLIESTNDTGRSQFDDVTRNATPTVFFRLDDNIFLNDVPGNPAPPNPAAPDEPIAIPFNDTITSPPGASAGGVLNSVAGLVPGYRVAVFIEGAPQQPGTLPETPIGFAVPVAGSPGVYAFNFATGIPAVAGGLTNGSHFISARVQMIDPSTGNAADVLANDTGFGGRSDSLEIVVDIVGPQVNFGLANVASDGLKPGSDTGVAGPANSGTLVDNITSEAQPTFWGNSEANSIVRLYVDVNGNGIDGADVIIGQTVASPGDGTNQLPLGQWEISSDYNLNDPLRFPLLPLDGLRNIFAQAEDVAGNLSIPVTLPIFIDTQGPQVFDPDGPLNDRHAIEIVGNNAYDLFDLKPNGINQGPTPLINKLRINIRDLPNRIPAFPYAALQESLLTGNPAQALGHFTVVGDHLGAVAITMVEFNSLDDNGPGPATGEIILTFAKPLPDDRFTLTISDELRDPAGNRLDGESNAAEPNESPTFPSGDGQTGGDFVARFTVDSRPEIGSYVSQNIDIDINGNFVWDPANGQIGNDATNVDLTFTLGVANANGSIGLGRFGTHDLAFAGEFTNGNAPASGNLFDQLAAYGWSSELNQRRWLVDTDSDGVITIGTDLLTIQPDIAGFNVAGAVPVAGNFDNNAGNGDEVGLYFAGQWVLDSNRNFVIDAADTFLNGNLFGHPIVGDFDGNGEDDLGVFNNNTWNFSFNPVGAGVADLDGNSDDTIIWGFPGVLDRPVATDMDQDGIDDIGLWVPRNSAQDNRAISEWYFLVSGNPSDAARNAAVGTSNLVDHPFEPVPFGNDLYAEFGDELALPIVGNFDPPVVAEDPTNQTIAETGDFDQDGDVDGSDFLAMQRGYGMTAEATMSDGDGNSDGAVDSYDMDLWSSGYQTAEETGDFDQDGDVDGSDFLALQRGYGMTAQASMNDGDGNSDGAVDSYDMDLWASGYQTAEETGDFDQDGDVDGGDFLALQRGYGMTAQASMNDGDGNSDGTVDSYDMQLWTSGYQARVAAASDFNDDGWVNDADVATWEAAYGVVSTPGMPGDATADGIVSGADFLALQRSYSHSTNLALNAVSSGGSAAVAAAVSDPGEVDLSTLDGVSAYFEDSGSAKAAAFEALDDNFVEYVDDNKQFSAATSGSGQSSSTGEVESPATEDEAWDLIFSDDEELLASLF